ncbi:hypothetical protein JCM10207_006857 [Rhodosporidiobolus poonsookiae]
MAARDLAPSSLFLALYLSYLVLLSVLYARRALKWKSRWTLLLVHVVLRCTGMALGVAFAAMEWEGDDGRQRVDVLIAYLVFSAEGYFSLLLCTYRFFIAWQRHHLPSPLIPDDSRAPHSPAANSDATADVDGKECTPAQRAMSLVHLALVGANACIVAGSAMMASSMSASGVAAERKQRTAKGLRVAGTLIFLLLGQAFLLLCLIAYRRARSARRTLLWIGATWPFLTVRGVYSVVSVLVPEYSYTSPLAYSASGSGFTPSFLAAEHCMSSLTEFCAAGLLVATYFSARGGGAERKGKRGYEETELRGEEGLRFVSVPQEEKA